MLSRRLLRVKVMQMVYAHNLSGETGYESIDKELQHSVMKSHELYYHMLLLPIAMKRLAMKRIENGRNKLRPTEEELNPNMKFVENGLIKQLEENKMLNDYVDATGISWDEDLLKIIFNNMIMTDMYNDYMASEEQSFEEDQKFIIRYFTKELAKISLMYEALEMHSIYWNDDVEFAISIAIKTFKLFDGNNGNELELFPSYKDSDDKEFVSTLLRKTLSTYGDTYNLIRKYSKNWDPERVAQMDVIIIVMAAAEMMSFHEMPIRVTLNEYIEISKYYSTAKSNVYINGILEKIVRQLVEDKQIMPAQLVNIESSGKQASDSDEEDEGVEIPSENIRKKKPVKKTSSTSRTSSSSRAHSERKPSARKYDSNSERPQRPSQYDRPVRSERPERQEQRPLRSIGDEEARPRQKRARISRPVSPVTAPRRSAPRYDDFDE